MSDTTSPAAPPHLVVMGVAGCGKTSLAERVAATLRVPVVEGDAFHTPASRDKMRRGVPLDDADRAGWLATLSDVLRSHPDGAVLACSALKRRYRDRLREGLPALRFAYLEIDEATARARVAQRQAQHLFPPTLVASQFATLEPPLGEAGVLRLQATDPLPVLTDAVVRWLQPEVPS
ncbi:gluconokinase [Aquabacterium sp. J223]|uniref:gluconokinase n=1 Tax=Aquabacterium sp. J223 TaxID=2898431 RepID=UPI0021AE1412|nr:gluconokinase [Aquabacterium sp. J223]UUX94173.1 gluconokinase [Aquabacterium sp. J223]